MSGSLDIGTRFDAANPFLGSGSFTRSHSHHDEHEQDLDRGSTGKSNNTPVTALLKSRCSVAGSPQGKAVIRDPHDLRIHPALLELGYSERIADLNGAEREKHSVPKPVFISSNGTILVGFARWRSAVLHREREIDCVEFTLTEEDSLEFILVHHKPQRGWNAFVRTQLALKLEPYFQQTAVTNMRNGGRYKGLAKLPSLQHLDVRSEIAKIAGVGTRNVGNVKLILKQAHPRLIHALCDGTLTINKARQLCKLPRSQQLDSFVKSLEEHEIDAVIRRTLSPKCLSSTLPDAILLLAAIQEQETHFPGSVSVSRTKSGGLTIFVNRDLVKRMNLPKELQPNETA